MCIFIGNDYWSRFAFSFTLYNVNHFGSYIFLIISRELVGTDFFTVQPVWQSLLCVCCDSFESQIKNRHRFDQNGHRSLLYRLRRHCCLMIHHKFFLNFQYIFCAGNFLSTYLLSLLTSQDFMYSSSVIRFNQYFDANWN